MQKTPAIRATFLERSILSLKIIVYSFLFFSNNRTIIHTTATTKAVPFIWYIILPFSEDHSIQNGHTNDQAQKSPCNHATNIKLSSDFFCFQYQVIQCFTFLQKGL